MPFHELLVYQKSFEWSMAVFGITKEGKYALTDQTRRSSRDVSAKPVY